jgi:DNA repair protein RecO (recombination protein O)
MKVELENAYVLHSRPFKDSSLLVDFFTENFGRITLVAKGARQQKKKGNFLLQPFICLKISWQGKSQLKTLISTEISTYVTNDEVEDNVNTVLNNNIEPENNKLQGNYLYSGFYANELLTYLLPFDEPNTGIFFLYTNLLISLKNKLDLEKTLRLFEFSLLSELGYGIDFISSASTNKSINSSKQYYYEPSDGFVCVGINDENKENSLIVGRHFFDGHIILGVYNQEYNNKTVRQAAKYISRISFDYLLMGKKIKSRDFFR